MGGCLHQLGPNLQAYDARHRADGGPETHDGPVESKEDHSTDQRDDRSQESHPLAVAPELDVGFETCQFPGVVPSGPIFDLRDDPICSTGNDGLAVAEGCGQRQRPQDDLKSMLDLEMFCDVFRGAIGCCGGTVTQGTLRDMIGYTANKWGRSGSDATPLPFPPTMAAAIVHHSRSESPNLDMASSSSSPTARQASRTASASELAALPESRFRCEVPVKSKARTMPRRNGLRTPSRRGARKRSMTLSTAVSGYWR